MKFFIGVLTLLLCQFISGGQDINYLFNKGIVTYVDNSEDAMFGISIHSDTLIRSEDPPGYYMDSSFYQITKWKIGEGQLKKRYSSEGERQVLDSFFKAERDYQEEQIFAGPLKGATEYFANEEGKQFLIAYYELPFFTRQNSEKTDSTQVKGVRYSVQLLFVANECVVMMSRAVFDTESLKEVMGRLKTKVANSVRIYPMKSGKILLDVLFNQIGNKIKGKPLVVNIPEDGFKMEIPFWVNIVDSKYDLAAGFPDVNNIVNFMVLIMPDKDGASFKEFYTRILESDKAYTYSEVPAGRDHFKQYKVMLKRPESIFHSHFVFFETRTKFGWLMFTATAETYDKNIGKLQEFVSKIEIE